MSTDDIYASDEAPSGEFEFSETVAQVFPDMLRRSIPGYAASIQAIGALAARYVTAGSRCYDLGCSLGAATIAMRRNIRAADCRIVAVDSAPAMVERCREVVDADDAHIEVSIIEGDIREIAVSNASMVVLNYTLQFLPVDERPAMIAKIYEGMLPGGILVLSEKVVDEDEEAERLLIDLHHEFKRRNAYSELEISRKRTALENVLVPDSETMHRSRLKEAGFRHVSTWLRYFNFISLVAVR